MALAKNLESLEVEELNPQTARAAASGSYIHPTVDVFQRHEDRLKNPPYDEIMKDLSQIELYYLEAPGMISIERYMGRHLSDPSNEKYDLIRAVLLDYSLRGVKNPIWETFPEWYFEERSLPVWLQTDVDGMAQFEARMQEVLKEVKSIEEFCLQLPNKPRSKKLRPLLERTVENFRGSLVPFWSLSNISA